MSDDGSGQEARGFDVFLSHNSQDKSAVELLANRLKQEAKLRPFLDKWHLVPGENWQPELEKALEESESVAIFFGTSGTGPWHNEELRLALSQSVSSRDEFRVIPVLLPGANPADVKGFLSQRTWVDFRSGLDDVDAFNRLVAGIKGLAPVSDTYRLPDEPAPYRGLLPFDKAHARFFFGREREIQAVLDKLKQHPFVAVVGASGVGKSSLVRGGVLPRLEDPAHGLERPVYLKTMLPGDRPLRALADQLATLVPPADRLRTAEDLAQRLAAQPETLHGAVRTLTAEQPGTFLLVVDQLEELFTHATGERAAKNAAAFVANLREAVEKGRGTFQVIATLRADFFERCLNLPALREWMQDHQVLLGSMGPEALREAIVRPAQAVGAFLEKGLVGTILKDVSQEPGTLPLLEHALYELWRARNGAWLTLSAYEASGGVTGALQRRAQACYEASKPEERELFRQLFLRLTTLGEGTPDTRRRVARAELTFPGVASEQVEHVLRVLSGPETRLLVADGDTVEVAHEVLIRDWPTLRRWLDEDRRELRILRRLTEAANEWEKQKRDLSYLYTGSRLLEAEERFAGQSGPLNQRERDFLRASLELRDAERRKEEKRRQQERETEAKAARRLQVLALVLAVAALGSFGLWQQAQQERKHAQQERDNARSRELTTKALMELSADPRKSRLDLEEAWRIAPNKDLAHEDLAHALSDWRKTPGLIVLRGHSEAVLAAAFSPDGSRIVTASGDNTARVWDAASGKLLSTLSEYTGAVWAVAFSPDSPRLVTTSQDNTARLWDASSSVPLLPPLFDTETSAAFSPDGSRIVTASWGNTARVWDTASGKLISTLSGHTKPVLAVAFSPNGSRIVTASDDETALVWDASSGTRLATLSGHTRPVEAAAFSSDGSRIVTASRDTTVLVWDAISGKRLSSIPDHTMAVVAVAFSPDGSRIVTGSWDNTARVWDATSGKPRSTLSGHTDTVKAVAFSPDGSRIVTASGDNTARVWDATSGKLLTTLSGHTEQVFAAAFSPDGSRIVTASLDDTARLWDADSDKASALLTHHTATSHMGRAVSPDGSRIVINGYDKTALVLDAASGKTLSTLVGHTEPLIEIAFSPDSLRIVTTSFDKTAIVWDAASGKRLLPPLSGHTELVFAAAFSPDGSHIVTASFDNTARVWNASAGTLLTSFSGHTEPVEAAAFSPDGSRIVTASADKTACVWDVASGKRLSTLSGHSKAVTKAAFSPDGSHIVTASFDNTARVWDASSGTRLATLDSHTEAVTAASFTSDGSHIVTASNDGTARVWSCWNWAPLETQLEQASQLEAGRQPVCTHKK